MDQPHPNYGASQLSLTPAYEADCGQSGTSHAEQDDFTTNGRNSLVSATNAVALSQVDDPRCMRQRNTNDSIFSLSQQPLHHADPNSIPSSPNTLASYSSARSPASHYGPSNSSLNTSSISYQLPASGYNTPSLQNSHSTYPSINGLSNCRSRAPSTTETSMFYAAVPPRSYAIGPNTLAASAPGLSATPRESYSSATQNLGRSIDYRSSLDISKPFPQTRSVYSPHTNMSYPHHPSIYANSTSYSTADYRGTAEEQSLPFENPETFLDLVSQEGIPFRPEITCKIEKGFFYSNERSWTCYRRNYFSVSCSYSFDPQVNGAAIYVKKKDSRGDPQDLKQIQALSLSLSASIDGANGKTIELVQHTPKRDKGPQLKVSYTKLCPNQKGPLQPTSNSMGHYSGSNYSYHQQGSTSSNCPILPLQATENQSKDTKEAILAGISFPPPTSSTHTFERIQFKNATANNGKRRAQQQYYHLIVELYADVRTSTSAPEEWVKIAHRVSHQVVVRGRSPSHYQNEGPSSNGRGTSMGAMGRQAAWNPHYSTSSGVYVSSSTNGRMLSTPSSYIYSSVTPIHEPVGSIQHTMLGSTGLPEPTRGMASTLANGRTLYTGHTGPGATDDDGYSYYPQTFYETGLSSPNGTLVKSEGKSSSSPESAAGTFSQAMPARYTGYDSSKGLYPSQTHAM